MSGLFDKLLHFDKTDLNKEMSMIDTNIRATHILTKLYLTEMKKKKQLLHAYYATVQIYIPPISVNGKNETR